MAFTADQIAQMKAAGLSDAAIADLAGFDPVAFQQQQAANQSAISAKDAAALAAAQSTGISNIGEYVNPIGAGDIIPGLVPSIMQNLGMYDPAYQAVMRTYGNENNQSNAQDVTERSTFAIDPNAQYRLLDASGKVIGTASTPQEVAALVAQANQLSQSGGDKASWNLQKSTIAAGSPNDPIKQGWTSVATDQNSELFDTPMKLLAAAMLAATGAGALQPGGFAGAGAAGGGAAGGAAGAAGAGLSAGASLAPGALASLPANLAAISAGAQGALAGAGLGAAGLGAAGAAGAATGILPSLGATGAVGASELAPIVVTGTAGGGLTAGTALGGAALAGGAAAAADLAGATDAAVSANTQNAVDNAYFNAQQGAAETLAPTYGTGAATGAAAGAGGGLLSKPISQWTVSDWMNAASLGGGLLSGIIGQQGQQGTGTGGYPYTSPFGSLTSIAGKDMRASPTIANYETYGFGPEATFFKPEYNQIVSGSLSSGSTTPTTYKPLING